MSTDEEDYTDLRLCNHLNQSPQWFILPDLLPKSRTQSIPNSSSE